MPSTTRSPAPPICDADGFLLRGVSVGRIEAFSDIVFGLALTLIVVSVQVPSSFTALGRTLHGFVPFSLCFALLVSIWHAHYKFFRRFAAHDSNTLRINAALLFVVMFYVYPLKFLFTLATLGDPMMTMMAPHEVKDLMILFGGGYSTIYLLISLLYGNVLHQRKTYELNPLEVRLTRGYSFNAAGLAAIGLSSCLVTLSLPDSTCAFAGLIYLLAPPWTWLMKRRGLALRARTEPAVPR